MRQDQKARALEIFMRALDLEAKDREAFIERSCNADGELRIEVQRLLELEERSSGKMSGLRVDAGAYLAESTSDVGTGEDSFLSRRRSPADVGERIGSYR